MAGKVYKFKPSIDSFMITGPILGTVSIWVSNTAPQNDEHYLDLSKPSNNHLWVYRLNILHVKICPG